VHNRLISTFNNGHHHKAIPSSLLKGRNEKEKKSDIVGAKLTDDLQNSKQLTLKFIVQNLPN